MQVQLHVEFAELILARPVYVEKRVFFASEKAAELARNRDRIISRNSLVRPERERVCPDAVGFQPRDCRNARPGRERFDGDFIEPVTYMPPEERHDPVYRLAFGVNIKRLGVSLLVVRTRYNPADGYVLEPDAGHRISKFNLVNAVTFLSDKAAQAIREPSDPVGRE